MFTGLIEDVGTLVQRRTQGRAAKVVVETALPLDRIAPGESIAVNGACLTVEAFPGGGRIAFHALQETLERTNLGTLGDGAPVNLERALRLGDRLGGHLVSGHVDATATIVRIGRRDDDIVLEVRLPEALRALVIPKGSIAVNGISLTIADLQPGSVSMCIIPHTWNATSLRAARTGELVNLEADMIGKYILRSRQLQSGNVSMDTLRDAGYL